MDGTNLFWDIGIVVKNAKYKANHSIQISFNDSTECGQPTVVDLVIADTGDVMSNAYLKDIRKKIGIIHNKLLAWMGSVLNFLIIDP